MSGVKHSERKHALLSASGSSRWLNCTPSARLEDKFQESKTSVFAEEGTLAHEFADIKLRHLNGEISDKVFTKELNKLRKHKLYTDEMEPEVQKFVDLVWEAYLVSKAKDPDTVLLVEQRLDFSHLVEKGFGTGDATIIGAGLLDVWDLKYGKGVRVDAKENSQLKLYGSGALNEFELLYDIKKVRLNIGQPRLNHVSQWELTVRKLEAWGEKTVKPKAAKAYSGEGRKKAGDWCRWCNVKAMCRTFAQHNIKLAQQEFRDPDLLSIEELTAIYKQQPMLSAWVNAVADHLLKEALAGKQVPGYKVVEGRSRRKWTDENKVVEILESELFDKSEFLETKVLGIAKIQKLTGAELFNESLSSLVDKPTGAPTLVDVKDARPEFKTSTAESDFAEPID